MWHSFVKLIYYLLFNFHEHLLVGLYACFVGVPLDIGASNRTGTRFGPRQIRTESALVRRVNMDTGTKPNR